MVGGVRWYAFNFLYGDDASARALRKRYLLRRLRFTAPRYRQHVDRHAAPTGDLEALEMGIDFEQRAVAYYQNQMERAEGALERMEAI